MPKTDEPIATSSPTTAPHDEAVPVVICCPADPADPYADVMAGVRFRWADGTLV